MSVHKAAAQQQCSLREGRGGVGGVRRGEGARDEKVKSRQEEGKGSGDYVYEAPSLCNLIGPHYNHGHSRNFTWIRAGGKWRPLFLCRGSCRAALPCGRWGLWPRWGTTLLREQKCGKMQYPKNVNPLSAGRTVITHPCSSHGLIHWVYSSS